ncbi:MAG: serine protein kinase, partial [Gammaproteobacteria bacterium]
MPNQTNGANRDNQEKFLDSLAAYTKEHSAHYWSGTVKAFLADILPTEATRVARTSHEYVWDMLRWYADRNPAANDEDDNNNTANELFVHELFGIDDALSRVVEYFKAASAGSDVGRRLLLLLGPPSGGKSTMVILLKRAMEEYSRTEEGALYAIAGCQVHESPLHLIPHTMRAEFRDTYDVDIKGTLCPYCRARLENEFEGDFMQMPVERLFVSEAARTGVGTYAPHDPSTADIADLVGSVDLSKVAEIGDEGDPRAWSWSGAVYAASRGVLEMIEILKVKREFLYLLLTLTQEKNVKVSRFPLIYLDETIIAHTNLAEFNKFLQEKENEALLDRMVIIKVPYTLSYREEARIYKKLITNATAFKDVHLDPHALKLAATFSILTRLKKPEREEFDLSKKVRLYADEDVEGFSELDKTRVKAETPDEGLTGVSPRFVINAISSAIIRSEVKSLTSMEVLLALKDSIESDARMEAKLKSHWIDFLVLARKDFYNRWVKEDVHKALFASFEEEAQQLLEKYLD